MLDTHLQYAKSALWCNAYKGIVFISDFPEENHTIKVNNRLIYHNENGPAIRFRDGYQFYALNGIRVKSEIVTTPAERLDPALLISETNIDIRREILRKIGIERALKSLNAKTIDTKEDYAIVEFDIGTGPIRMLRMKNPSLGIWHLEGIPRECKNVSEALNSRKPEWMRRIPVNDTEGLDWYQQGDVLIVPNNAKSLKANPKILT